MIKLNRSDKKGKKYMVRIGNKTIHFGSTGYEDYTIHKDAKRKSNYISRHKANENWNKGGMNTAGFWPRWLLWNLPSIGSSIKDIESRFNVKVQRILN